MQTNPLDPIHTLSFTSSKTTEAHLFHKMPKMRLPIPISPRNLKKKQSFQPHDLQIDTRVAGAPCSRPHPKLHPLSSAGGPRGRIFSTKRQKCAPQSQALPTTR